MKKLATLLSLTLFLFGHHAFAQKAQRKTPAHRSDAGRIVVSEIVIEGNKKIEKDAILAKLKSRVGEPYSTELVHEDVRSIFDLGYFFDIQVIKTDVPKGIRLTYKVVEKPSVVEITFRGNSELTENDLKEAIDLKPYQIQDISKIQKAQDKLSKLYEDKGFFLAKISFRFEKIGNDNDRVRLVFDIEENEKVKVKSINFIGNTKIPDSEIKRVMQTSEEGFFSFLSSSGSYKQEVFDRDVQIISYLYYNRGYVQVKVSKPIVSVSPDKKGIYISIRIEEGEQFEVGDVEFQGDLLFSNAELYDTIKIDKSNIFVAQTLQEDVSALQAKYGDLGYAYANPIPLTTLREKERKVDIVFKIEKGNKVYFGKFNIVGNSRTRDKVVRREMQIQEGELYNETKKRESLANIKRLGFFDDVTLNPKTPENSPDVMNLDVSVTERNTGSLQVGAGYSSYSKANFYGNIQQANLFGRGQKLGLYLNWSKFDQSYSIDFTEPHFLDTDWSTGFDVYRTKRIVEDIYDQRITGASVRVGHPITDYLKGWLRYKNDITRVELASGTNPILYPVNTVNGRTSSLTFTLEYDKRDDRMMPTDGFYANTSFEYAGLGGDLKYTLSTATARFYQKIFWDLVWRNNVTYGIISAPNGREPPYTQLFLLGGANNLRGYQYSHVGKRILDTTKTPPQEVPFGGKQELFLNMEIEFPLISEAGIKGVVFYDIGQAEDNFKGDKFQADYGFGFRWFSPIGPLRFEWGFPLDAKTDDSATNFEFSIGSPF